MPELPEVECIVRTLRPTLPGASIRAVELLSPNNIREPDPAAFAACIVGRRIVDISRRGKYLVTRLDAGWWLLVHLGMTGQLLLQDGHCPPPRFARVAFHLSDGPTLWFADMRKFGRLVLTRRPEATLGHLGPEPLDPRLKPEDFARRLQGSRRPVKTLLLDQSFLAGIGNIYADEALFEARIDPRRRACTLSAPEGARLLEGVRTVLQRGIANHGTTIATYVDASGLAGSNQKQLKAYRRAGERCLRCQGTISRVVLGGRSTCFCPTCQPRRHRGLSTSSARTAANDPSRGASVVFA